MQLAAIGIQRAWRGSWLRWGAWRPGVGYGWRRQRATDADAVSARPRSGAAGEAAAGRASRAEVIGNMHRRHLELLKWQCTVGLGKLGRRQGAKTFQDFCALRIQAFWRAWARVRRQRRVAAYTRMKVYQVAATEIQRRWRRFGPREAERRAGQRLLTPGQLVAETEGWGVHEATEMIQRCWRCWQDRRVYLSLRDVICGFQSSGDPYLLLRTVLPRESMLLDPAMQAHVRFRLGGSKFPPAIYYKVFTHGAVCDVGSFAPRNYAAGPAPGADEWYVRQENNGWRPLAARADRSAGRPGPDEVERASSRKAVPGFHFSRLQRRQDMDRRRRQRTVAWMRKLYGLQALADGQPALGSAPGTTSESESTASGAHPSEAAGSEGPSSSRTPSRQSAAGALTPRPPEGPPPAGIRPQRAGSQARARRVLVDARWPDWTPERGVSPWSPVSTPAGASPEGCGDDLLDDDLLRWSSLLDFDAYMQGWQSTATSGGSDGTLPIGAGTRRRPGSLVAAR